MFTGRDAHMMIMRHNLVESSSPTPFPAFPSTYPDADLHAQVTMASFESRYELRTTPDRQSRALMQQNATYGAGPAPRDATDRSPASPPSNSVPPSDTTPRADQADVAAVEEAARRTSISYRFRRVSDTDSSDNDDG